MRNKETKQKCKKCTCAEISKFDEATVKRVCEKKGKNRTAKKCCKMCQDIEEKDQGLPTYPPYPNFEP